MEGDNRFLTRTFSEDSLGESTRSLLSPFYSEGGNRFDASELSEGSLSSNGEEHGETDSEVLHHPKQTSKDESFDFGDKTKSFAKQNKSTTAKDPSFSRSKQSSGKILGKITGSESISNTKGIQTNSSTAAGRKEDCLSPWESWLVKKSAEDREKNRQKRLQNRKEKQERENEQRKRSEELKKASEEVAKWMENKRKTVSEERRKKQLREQLEEEKKLNSNRLILEKATVVYNNWLESKKEQEKKEKRKGEEEARIRKEKDVERKMNSEEAYSRWIAKAKERPKPVYNSFGYTGGMLTGYYEWGSYPAPSYFNPIPWVPPKVKRNSDRRKGRMEIQPASPPLLFRDIENRKAKEKNK
ncbi:coiled-coil domain-containing protein 34-like [Montipora foliosa]|uniref:coiled-coil domain-containing protein 34-like n=1 Tax=Montipora foliosa TaxID=591990 RepID=UPI0035F198B6